MPQITVDFDSRENKEIEIFKAKEGLKNKSDAVKKIIRTFFNIKK
ncbi:DUF2683 family protein [Candidatus Woesearchaeota archaeon]|nr:DUF2683 family protein [Candidatus Woesearchaeota archaeon]